MPKKTTRSKPKPLLTARKRPKGSALLVAVVLTVGAGVAIFNLFSHAATAYPGTPPARICGNAAIPGEGPTSAPAGAVTVPAGNNSGVNFGLDNTTFWFAPGAHTLGTGEFSQIDPGSNSTYIGAPGAILDGQRINRYAFPRGLPTSPSGT